MTKKIDRAYRHKDVQDLTSKDIKEMLEDYRNMKEEQDEINAELLRLQQKQTALYIVQAIVESAGISGDMKDGALTALDAFKEYAEQHGGTVRGFFRDPDLPEILQQIRNRAIELLKEKTAENDTANLPPIRYKSGKSFKVSTDKFATTFFGIGAPTKRNLAKGLMKGQITFEQLRNNGIAAKYEKDGEQEVSLFYDYLPDEKTLKKYGIPEDFTDFDFFVMTIIDNLYAEGNEMVTLRKVCQEIGLKGAGGPQRKNVMLSLIKGLSTIITINVTDIKKEWGIDLEEKENMIISPAIPVMIDADQYKIHGTISDASIIKITDFSPFYRISAVIRGGRFSTWPKEVLQLYNGRRTDRYYSVMRYLLREIGWLKAPHSTRNNKLTYSDLYEHTGAKTTRDKQLTDDMMHTILNDVFKKAGIISKYNLEKRGNPGVIITLPAPELPPPKKP